MVEMFLVIMIFIGTLGGGIGGFLLGQNAKPTTTINVTEQKTESYQTSIQGQMTLVTPITNVNVNIRGYTNFNLNRSTNFNRYNITNILEQVIN